MARLFEGIINMGNKVFLSSAVFPAVFACLVYGFLTLSVALADPFPPYWNGGTGAAVHFAPAAWPNEPGDAADCGDNCGQWKPYTRFQNSINDPRAKDPSNGGTAPQNYVNITSSCIDKDLPSIYYYLHQGATPEQDVIMFRWRVEQIANTYATGPNAGTYGASQPWSSALWSVLFDVDGSGYRNLAAHLNGSTGSPATPIDMLAGIWSEIPSQSLDYLNNPAIHLLGHNPTAFVDDGTNRILNFQNTLNPTTNWPNGAAETSWDYGTTRARLVSTRSCNEYFIDYQIPVAMLDASGLGGPKITRSTPIAMMFCTANSLNNPFQKDCAIDKTWAADSNRPAPYGDYISFNKEDPYSQPIVSSVTAIAPTTCGQDYQLTAKVQDVLAVTDGAVVPSVQAVDFYYWHDANGSGVADDAGGAWIHAASATLQPGSMNTWTANWNATSLPKGRFLIGVQALDDNRLVDDGMIATGVDNRTFSYLPGDAQSRIYAGGVWMDGQEAAFPTHSPVQLPHGSEDWYGNPDVTGIQTALVGVAINSCGIAPSLGLVVDKSEVGPGETVVFTLTVSNAGNPDPITVSSLRNLLPDGFSYQGGSTAGDFGTADPTMAGQELLWSFGTPVVVAANGSASLDFAATASATAGEYNSLAQADSSFGLLDSDPVAVAVGSARLTLGITPDVYSLNPGGQVSYTLSYSNPTSIGIVNAELTVPLPANTSLQSCTPGCSSVAGQIRWDLGLLAGGASGSVSLVLSVEPAYASTTLQLEAALVGQDPAESEINATAGSTIHVNVPVGSIAAFTLEKTASMTLIDPADSVTYTIVYHNYGGATASDVIISDDLPAGMSFASCTGACSHDAGTVSWNLGSVTAGASGSVSVTVTAANPFESPNPAVNTAALTWDGGGPVQASANVGVTGQSCSTYYFRDDNANVGFDGNRRIATALPVPLAGDAGASVTVVAPNSGQPFGEAIRFYQDPATLVDTEFSGNVQTRLFIDRANGPGLDLRATLYDYDSVTGGSIQLGQQTFAFGGNQKGALSFSVPVSGTLSKDHRLLWVVEVRSQHNSQTYSVQIQYDGTVANAISGSNTFADSGASFCVTPPANLSVDKAVDLATVAENTATDLVYTLRYANTGSTLATGAAIVDTLPDEVFFISAELNGDPIVPTGSNPYTFAIGDVAAGASGSLVIQAAVSDSASGLLTNRASIQSDQTSAVEDTATTLVGTPGGGGGGPTAPALFISKAADRSVTGAAGVVTYGITVVNAGNGAANGVVVTDEIPAQAYFSYTSCTTASGNCAHDAGTLTWTIGTLNAGQVASMELVMQTDATGLPDGLTLLTNLAMVSDDDFCTGGTPPDSCTSNTVGLLVSGNPELDLDLTASAAAVAPGDLIEYTLTVSNGGSSAATGVMLYNPIPNYTGFVEITTGAGSFDTVNNRVMFSVGSLAAGASETYRFTVRVGDTLGSGSTSLVNTATASAGNAAVRTAMVTSTATAAPDLVLAISGPGNVPLPAAILAGDASATTILFVNSAALLGVGDYVRIAGTLTRITALVGNQLTVDTPVTAANGTLVQLGARYSILYQNAGNAAADALDISLPLPAGWLYAGALPAPGSAPAPNSNGTLGWTLGTLAAGESGTLQFVAIPTASGSHTLTATLSADDGLEEQASSITLVGGLLVGKTSADPTATAGGSVEYTIHIGNSLGVPVNGVQVMDILPAGFAYQAATPEADGYQDGDTARPFWNLDIPANGSVTITLAAIVGNDVGAATYQNEVEVLAPAGVGVVQFDALATTAEDVTVLAGSGLVVGYVYRETADGNAPMEGIWAHFLENDVLVYSEYTDAAGRFQRVLEAGAWQLAIGGVAANQASLSGLMAAGDPASFDIDSGALVNLVFLFSEPDPEPDPEPERQERVLQSGEHFDFAPPAGSALSQYSRTRGGQSTEVDNPTPEQYAGVLVCEAGTCRFIASRSGRYEFTFDDGDGGVLVMSFVVHPNVAFATAFQAGTAGEPVTVRVVLDDLPVEAEARVPFSVENSAWAMDPQPHDLFSRSPQVLVFDVDEDANVICSSAGACYKDLEFTPTLSTGHIRVHLLDNQDLEGAWLGSPALHTVNLVSAAQRPLGAQLVLQPGNTVPVNAPVDLEVSGLPAGGNFAFGWEQSDASLGIGALDTPTIAFNPPAEGLYFIQVRVSDLDNGNRPAILLDTWLRVVATEQLATHCGGDCDDQGTAIPLPLQAPECGLGEEDPLSFPYRLQVGEGAAATRGLCLETTPGYGLRLGTVSFLAAPSYGAGIQAEAIRSFGNQGREALNASDPEYQHIGLYYDFEVTRLDSAGQAVRVVIPLPRNVTIPQHAVWRKYHPVQGWYSFSVAGSDEANAVYSAARIADACPGPGSGQWTPGLVAGHGCVRLTLQDGGANDLDGQANGVIRDPGTLALPMATSSPPPGGHKIISGGEGGGAISPWTLLAGLGWLLWRLPAGRRLFLLASLLLVPLQAGAGDLRAPGWYLGGVGGIAMGEVDSAEVTRDLQSLGIDATARVEDLDRPAWRVFGGYRFERPFALEVGYTYLGTVTTWVEREAPVDLDDIPGVPPASGRGLEVAASAFLPLGERLDLYGRLGVWHWQARYHLEATGQTRRPSDGLDILYGAGLRYWLTDRWQAGLSWDRYRIHAEDVDLIGLGLVYRLR